MESTHWQQIRIQASIAAMQGLLNRQYVSNPEMTAKEAVRYADALILKLQEDEKTDNT